jgi:hypothetical protein
MVTWPVVVVLGANVGLGLYLARFYLAGQRNGSLLRGIHLILGLAAMESLAMVGLPSDTPLLLVGGALFAGLVASLMYGRKIGGAGLVWMAHAAAGIIAFGVFLRWVV